MTSFTDLTKQIHSINDLILSDMVGVSDNATEVAADFSKHLITTKSWFFHISSVNKKRYLLALLQDVRSAWTLSLLLKSIWNCRPKDAVMSINESDKVSIGDRKFSVLMDCSYNARGGCLSIYDQVPMDHNRTALPVSTLALAMKSDRAWFLSLGPGRNDYLHRAGYNINQITRDFNISHYTVRFWINREGEEGSLQSHRRHGRRPTVTTAQREEMRRAFEENGSKSTSHFAKEFDEPQAQVLLELLSISGGPAMSEVYDRAQTLYERRQEQILQSLHECIVVSNTNNQKSNASTNTNKKQSNKEQPTPRTTTTPEPVTTEPEDTTTATAATTSSSQGKKILGENLLTWNATIKTMRDSLKLEEFEMTFHDGTKKKIWKVDRPKPDVVETVDFLQLLPSAVGKKILSFLPLGNLSAYASVNKYWAYLVDEYNHEIITRAKINADIDRLKQIVIKNDESVDQFIGEKDLAKPALSSSGYTTTGQPITPNKAHQTIEKSIGIYSLRHFSDKLHKPKMVQKPIHNMTDFYERLERRGAVDENIWQWCENIIALTAKQKPDEKKKYKTNKQVSKPEVVKGILLLDNMHFRCPLMKFSLIVPLKPPLYKDPAEIKSKKRPKCSISDASLVHAPKEAVRRWSLWTRDVSSLYPVVKIPSYQFPFNVV